MLSGPLPAWDLERRPFDAEPVIAWALAAIRETGVATKSLETLHESTRDGAHARDLGRHLCESSRAHAVQRLVHRAVIAALPDLPWDSLAIQAITHVRILVPGDEVSPVPLHTDHGIGHPLHERNLWIPLTPARASGALHVLPLAASIPLERARERAGAVTVAEPAPAEPCEMDPGDVLLLTPIHVHGARAVREPRTRVSIDIRIAPRVAAAAKNPCTFVAPRT